MAKPPTARKQYRKSPPGTRQPALWGKDTLLIERMSQEGRGIASRAGKIVFVSDALAGEQVRVQCTAVKRDYDEADMIELVADTPASPARTPPECPLYERCGGCSLQHWSLAAQQQHKQANLLAMLQAIAPGLALEPPITGPAGGFRHRLRLVVSRAGDGGYLLGLRQRRSHAMVTVEACPVANTAVNELLRALPGMLSAVPELQGLRELEIDADSEGRQGLCFYFAAQPGDKALAALRAAVMGDTVVALRVRLNPRRQARKGAAHDEPGDEDSPDWQELHAEGELCLRLAAPAAPGGNAGSELLLSYLPGDFTQTHWEVNGQLVARALDWLQPTSDESALDLFSGIGNFSLPLARLAHSVIALEGSSAMTLRLGANAGRNNIDNISARTVNLMAPEVVLPKADIAIIDPPRAGAKAVCEALARSKLRRLVYISCHPATLQRDARILQGAGFTLARAASVDMFPHTGHSEAIALFQRKPKR